MRERPHCGGVERSRGLFRQAGAYTRLVELRRWSMGRGASARALHDPNVYGADLYWSPPLERRQPFLPRMRAFSAVNPDGFAIDFARLGQGSPISSGMTRRVPPSSNGLIATGPT